METTLHEILTSLQAMADQLNRIEGQITQHEADHRRDAAAWPEAPTGKTPALARMKRAG